MADESLDRLVESLAQINVNLESLRVSFLALTESRIDHEHRLRLVERWRYQLSPVIAAITFLLGVICSSAVNRLW